ncbi:hypothetical protein ACW2Q0_21895 [Nocardia sp. R16R-3T]
MFKLPLELHAHDPPSNSVVEPTARGITWTAISRASRVRLQRLVFGGFARPPSQIGYRRRRHETGPDQD